mmetsp:Transcript_3179/g.7464  ORF Transcript_3179/g.7464 Transcript_3179/m.7464 type:complete len:235 (-) Transcript_3179:1072-1776(-)
MIPQHGRDMVLHADKHFIAEHAALAFRPGNLDNDRGRCGCRRKAVPDQCLLGVAPGTGNTPWREAAERRPPVADSLVVLRGTDAGLQDWLHRTRVGEGAHEAEVPPARGTALDLAAVGAQKRGAPYKLRSPHLDELQLACGGALAGCVGGPDGVEPSRGSRGLSCCTKAAAGGRGACVGSMALQAPPPGSRPFGRTAKGVKAQSTPAGRGTWCWRPVRSRRKVASAGMQSTRPV